MERLSPDWITDKHIDLEYKKYVLLAYLKRVEMNFKRNRLYPYFHDLKRHYSNLISLRTKKDSFSDSFPRELSGIDLKEQKLQYRSLVHDDELMEEIDRIIDLSIPEIKGQLEEGERIRTSVLDHMEIAPVGIMPLRKAEGYLLLSRKEELRVYEFRLNRIRNPLANKRYKDVRTRFIYSRDHQWIRKEQVKEELIRKDPTLPNPAVFSIESDLDVPHIETLLPIAKEVLLHLIEKLDAEPGT